MRWEKRPDEVCRIKSPRKNVQNAQAFPELPSFEICYKNFLYESCYWKFAVRGSYEAVRFALRFARLRSLQYPIR